jgi:glycosyltransferase involved in cell wall biosynthesis
MMKKILHFHPNEFFSKKFVDPLIIAEKNAGFNSHIVNSITSKQTQSIKIKFNLFSRDLLTIPIAIYQISKLIAQLRPDIVVCHNSRSSPLPIILSKILGVKRIIYFNHGVPFLGYKFLFRFILKYIEKLNILFSNEIITVSSDMKCALIQLTKKDIHLINQGSCCGLDLNEFSREKYLDSRFREKNDIKKTDTLIVFIGRPVARKGFNTVINLWSSKFKNKENFKLIMCGSSKFDAQKIKFDLPENIIFMGFTKNIPEILCSSDILLIPSLHEGLSYSCLEAMASGCAVIANNIPGIKCLIDNYETGLLVDIEENDIEMHLYQKILLLNDDINLKKYIVSKAEKKARQFSRDLFIKSYIKYIDENIN